MLTALIIVFVVGIITPLLFKLSKKYAPIIISILPLSLLIYYLYLTIYVIDNQKFIEYNEWFPLLSININFSADGLSLLFSLIITGIGTAVFFYASKYMKDYPFMDRFYSYITLFMGSMIGVVQSDNLVSTFIFWEITSITSFLLIGFNHHQERSRYSALQALLVTGLGGVTMLAGFLYIIIITGANSFSELLANKDILLNHPDLNTIIILILFGAFTKSAQFPFHFWLPNAMEAPTPVSAYLHSATMVKAGVYLMARLSPIFSGVGFWNNILLYFGLVTMFLGAVIAIKKTDLKQILAYTTVSVLGTLTFLLGIGTEYALKAFVVYLTAHSLYKGALFLLAGIIDHQTGTRDITLVSGLRRLMPFSFIIGLLAILSMSGVPPFIGFIGKELLYEASLFDTNIAIFSIVFISSVFNMIAALMSGLKPFIGESIYPNELPVEAKKIMFIPPLILASLGLLIGLIPNLGFSDLFSQTFNVIGNNDQVINLSLWHGFNLVLLLSIATLALGFLIFVNFNKLLYNYIKYNESNYLKAEYYYDMIFNSLMKLTKLSTRFIQNGYLRSYISIILFIFGLLIYYTLLSDNNIFEFYTNFDVEIYEVFIFFTLITAAIISVKSQGRLSAVASLGIVGFSVAIIFVIYGAPDLAMTQFAVETLIVIIFVLIIYKLPKFKDFSSLTERLKDIILSSLIGLGFTIIVLLVYNYDLNGEFKKYFSENSYQVAKGLNIVNVILVDFRALDTMGEIVVLTIASIGIYALLKYKNEEA